MDFVGKTMIPRSINTARSNRMVSRSILQSLRDDARMTLWMPPRGVHLLSPQHQLQHRWLSTPSVQSGATRGKRKNPSSVRRPTVKDRLRSRGGSNKRRAALGLSPSGTGTLIGNETLLAERMTTRLQWARDSLNSVWKHTMTDAAVGSGSGSGSGSRPLRYELKMDANWWFWNLVLGASPGLFIAAYCEWVAKPEMKRHYEEAQKRVGVEGGPIVPPPALSLWDAGAHFVDWWQGRDSTDSPRHKPAPSSSSKNKAGSENPISSLELTQLQDLKRQIHALEAQMLRRHSSSQEFESSSPSPAAEPTPRRSPMHQRRLDRKQKQQEEQGTLPTTEYKQEEGMFSRLFTLWKSVEQITPHGLQKHTVGDIPLPARSATDTTQSSTPVLANDTTSSSQTTVSTDGKTTERSALSTPSSSSSSSSSSDDEVPLAAPKTSTRTPWWKVW